MRVWRTDSGRALSGRTLRAPPHRPPRSPSLLRRPPARSSGPTRASGRRLAALRAPLAGSVALRRTPALAGDYWKLKQRLAARFPDDRAAYTDGKSGFIREVLQSIS